MWLVTIFGACILVKQEHSFEKIEEANAFLTDKEFVYDGKDAGVHYWCLDENTYALIEKS